MPCRTDTCAHSANVAAALLQPDVHRSVPGSGMRVLVRVHGVVHSTTPGALFSAQLRQLCLLRKERGGVNRGARRIMPQAVNLVL